jgi:hypothetical protein
MKKGAAIAPPLRHQPTAIFEVDVYSEPLSSFQANLNSPDSVALKKND